MNPSDRHRVERPAGSDTREAGATPSVRAAARAAAFAAGPGWACALGMPAAWEAHVAMPSSVKPWAVVLLATSGIAAAILAWRYATGRLVRDRSAPPTLPPGLGALATIALLGFIAVASRDDRLISLTMIMTPSVAGWFVGQAARFARDAVVPDVVPAAAGIVTTAALGALLFGGHLVLVAQGSGLPRAGGWTIAYSVLAAFNLLRARAFLPADRDRIASRIETPAASRLARDRGDALLLDGITVSFGPTTVLYQTSLAARAGELVALVGGNGAGKSTLLRVAAGLISPRAGRVLIAGEDLTTLRPEERAEAGLAFVSGARPVFPDLSVIDNLRVAAYRTHLTPRSFNAATNAVLELVPALANRRKAKAGVLSGGEQRMLAVAQTLYRSPVALLADELTLGLDYESRQTVLDLLRLLAGQGVAVVVVDHDLPSLIPRADRAVLLSHGNATNFDDPRGILDQRSDLLPAVFLAGVAK